MYLLFPLIFSYIFSCLVFYGAVSLEPLVSILMPTLVGLFVAIIIFVISMFIGGSNPQGGDHKGADFGLLISLIIFIGAVPLGIYLTGNGDNLKEMLSFTGVFVGSFAVFVFISLRIKKYTVSRKESLIERQKEKAFLEDIEARKILMNSPEYLSRKKMEQEKMLKEADELLQDSGLVLDDDPTKKSFPEK